MLKAPVQLVTEVKVDHYNRCLLVDDKHFVPFGPVSLARPKDIPWMARVGSFAQIGRPSGIRLLDRLPNNAFHRPWPRREDCSRVGVEALHDEALRDTECCGQRSGRPVQFLAGRKTHE
jgi:hypothetical protein